MREVISVVGTLAGVVIGFTLSLLQQRRIKKKRTKEIAYSLRVELELNLGLIKLIQDNIDDFTGSTARIATDETHPFRIYNNLFDRLPNLGHDLFTQIKCFYDLANIKYRQLQEPKNPNYSKVIKILGIVESHKIGTNWKEGWKELDKMGQEIINRLDKFCR